MAEQKQEEKPGMRMNRETANVGRLIRILQTDIPGNKNIYAGLTRIKGVSWGISNATCILMGYDKSIKIQDLSKEDIAKIEAFLKKGDFPQFLLNRKNDFATGEDGHLIGADLDLAKEFDIKRLKKIKAYKGVRHSAGLPVRGQKTRSNFRKNRKRGVGVKKKGQAANK